MGAGGRDAACLAAAADSCFRALLAADWQAQSSEQVVPCAWPLSWLRLVFSTQAVSVIIWDWDLPSTPTLRSLEVKGQLTEVWFRAAALWPWCGFSQPVRLGVCVCVEGWEDRGRHSSGVKASGMASPVAQQAKTPCAMQETQETRV